MTTTVTPAADTGLPDINFGAFITDEDIKKDFGSSWQVQLAARVRIAMLVLRDDRAQLTERFRGNPEGLCDMAEMLVGMPEHLKRLAEFVDGAIARLIIVGEAIGAEKPDES